MSDPIRELLRSAQAMEIQGNKAEALQLLTRAAALYQSSGRSARAEQMLRQIERLSHPQQLPDRGPIRSQGGSSAWCSFCCRPHTEVGELVAGPAGAFICGKCLADSIQLLDLKPALGHATGEMGDPPAEGTGEDFIGQEQAVALLEWGLGSSLKWLLLTGPEGSGKTTYLQKLSHRGRGAYVKSLEELDRARPESLLLLDQDRWDDGLFQQACQAALKGPARKVLLAARGTTPKPRGFIEGAQIKLPLLATEDIRQAVPDLSLQLAERVQLAVAFDAPSREVLKQIGLRYLQGSKMPAAQAGRAAEFAAKLALQSGRGGHELLAILARIPAGEWTIRRKGGQ